MDKYVIRPVTPGQESLPRTTDRGPTCVELFAGAGGMALGLEAAGFEHVALVERDRECVATLRRNGFGRRVQHKDARVVDYTRWRGADLVAGGPPCQPFSTAGQNKGQADPRDGWPAAVRAVAEIRPKAFVFENVAGLAREKFTAYFQSVLKRFWDLGYGVHVHIVDAADYGVAQHRKRLFVVGFLGARWFPKPVPTVVKHVTTREVLDGLGSANGVNGHVARRSIPKPYKNHTGSVLDKPARTVTAGTNGVAGGTNMVRLDDGTYRYFTARELACLQTFPHSFKLPSVWVHTCKQMGNACPVKLAEVFGLAVLQVLKAT